MSTVIRTKISKRSKYYIPTHRYLELMHFCLQYPDWVKEYQTLLEKSRAVVQINNEGKIQKDLQDPTGNLATRLNELDSKISLVGKIAKMSDEAIGGYILKGVTEGLSFVNLKTVYEIPCGRDMYYDRYRKFFWMLDKIRN